MKTQESEIKEKEEILITRTSFCKECYVNKKPEKGDKFLLYKGENKNYCVKTITSRPAGKVGFTPHIFKLIDVSGDENPQVVYSKVCCICGVDIQYIKKEEIYKASFIQEKIYADITPVENWNALVEYTRDLDFFLT